MNRDVAVVFYTGLYVAATMLTTGPVDPEHVES